MWWNSQRRFIRYCIYRLIFKPYLVSSWSWLLTFWQQALISLSCMHYIVCNAILKILKPSVRPSNACTVTKRKHLAKSSPLTLKLCGRSGVTWPCFSRGEFPNSTHQGRGANCTRFGENRVPSSLHQIGWGPLKEEWCRRSRPNFTLFDPPL